jgi:hypothetical protein
MPISSAGVWHIIGGPQVGHKSFILIDRINHSDLTTPPCLSYTGWVIIVIDYNVGNVKSVCNAFQHIGCPVELSRDPDLIAKASGLVLPGVAAFGYAVEALGSADECVKQAAAASRRI